MDGNLPGSSVHEIFQARILDWVAIYFSRGSSKPRVRTRVSYWLSYKGRPEMQYLGAISKMTNYLCSFPRQTIQYHSNPSLWATSNAEEAEVERFYEDLQELLELTAKKDVLFTIGDWNAKVGSQETPGVTSKFGLRVQNEAGPRLIEFCQENALS